MPQNTKEPWFKLWAEKWLGDSSLSMCSPAAQGLWISMCCIIHQNGIPPGHLSLDGLTPMSTTELSRLTRIHPNYLQRLQDELQRYRVYQRTDRGVIFCPWMVQAAEKTEIYRANVMRRYTNPPTAVGPSVLQTEAPAVHQSVVPLVNENGEQTVSSLLSHSSAGKGEWGEGAIIPSADEVVAYGTGAPGIPGEFCRRYHERKEIARSWTVKGQLVDWRREIRFWWSSDREKWKPAVQKKRHAELDNLQSLLQGEPDQEKRAALRAQIKRLKA